ncbi:MAG: glutamate-cysteine ligase family protein [Myxococcota bacterium]
MTKPEEDREPLGVFAGFGIEIEYMIVDRESLDVRPVVDHLLEAVAGSATSQVERGEAAWSNELALHVIEFKTNGPSPQLDGLADLFTDQVKEANRVLSALGCCLLPTGMHPWMDPQAEVRLWPHENDVIYRTFDRIFGCKGHGWGNLQSIHVNLPFSNDAEFGRLHAAIRMALPLFPGLAASTPIADGRRQTKLDYRLDVYRDNARAIPSVTGRVVPEPVYTRAEYEDGLLAGIYRDLKPHDPEGVLRHEWVNARGCIARFDRMAIEIRILDTQEAAQTDLAVVQAVVSAVRSLYEEHTCGAQMQKQWDGAALVAVLDQAITRGDDAVIDQRRYLDALGYPDPGRAKLRDVWLYLKESFVKPEAGPADSFWRAYERSGCLANRVLQSLGGRPAREELRTTYRELAIGLPANRVFDPS